MKYPLARLIKIPKPYVHSSATNIRKTIKSERERLKKEAVCKPLRKITPLRRNEK